MFYHDISLFMFCTIAMYFDFSHECYSHSYNPLHLRYASTLSVLAGDCVQRHDRGRPDCDCRHLLTWCALFLHRAP